LKKALYVLQYTKSTSQADAMSNSDKIKPVALAIIKLCLSEDISTVSQSVENSVKNLKKKINHSNGTLGRSESLVLPSQCCPIAVWEN